MRADGILAHLYEVLAPEVSPPIGTAIDPAAKAATVNAPSTFHFILSSSSEFQKPPRDSAHV
jgi:hypothetical protein